MKREPSGHPRQWSPTYKLSFTCIRVFFWVIRTFSDFLVKMIIIQFWKKFEIIRLWSNVNRNKTNFLFILNTLFCNYNIFKDQLIFPIVHFRSDIYFDNPLLTGGMRYKIKFWVEFNKFFFLPYSALLFTYWWREDIWMHTFPKVIKVMWNTNSFVQELNSSSRVHFPRRLTLHHVCFWLGKETCLNIWNGDFFYYLLVSDDCPNQVSYINIETKSIS